MDKFGVAATTGWSMDDFPLAVSVVYGSTPSGDRGLRDSVVETCCTNIDKLLQHYSFCKLLRETPDFAADLIPVLCGRRSITIQRYECPSCQHAVNTLGETTAVRTAPQSAQTGTLTTFRGR
jgi:speckle-type POZ protein